MHKNLQKRQNSRHLIWSLKLRFLFIIIYAFLLLKNAAFAFSEDPDTSNRIIGSGPNPSVKYIGFQIGASYKVILSEAGRYWAPYPAAGISLDLPTVISRLLLKVGFDIGRLTALSSADVPAIYANMYIAEINLSLSYDIAIPKYDITLRPRFGLCDMMIHPKDSKRINIIASGENEFGILWGAELVWHMGKFTISVPIQFACAFSHPERFVTSSVSLYLGGIF